MKILVLLVSFISFSFVANSSSLSNEALFNRCYSHLTKKRLRSSHQLLKQVKNGVISPIDACLSVLNKSLLKTNGIISVNDAESRSVIKNLTEFHNSFFTDRALRIDDRCAKKSTLDFRDELTPAYYFTKSLLDPNSVFSDILKGVDEYRGLRMNPSPVNRGPASLASAHTASVNDQSVVWNVSNAFIGSGETIGVEKAPVLINPQYDQSILGSIGGGIIGSRTYLQRSFRNENHRSDGGAKMNRRWAQAVVKDFLCRELPLVRDTDAQPFLVPDSSVTFRTQSSCLGCHATMDQLSGAIRGVHRETTGKGGCDVDTNARTEHMLVRTSDRPAAEKPWPDNPSNNYYRRPPEGHLYFRSYNGELINKKFANIEELGKHIRESNDFYACTAKKYYHFFTGVSVSLADINDPFANVILNPEDLKHRNAVIKMGLNLKSHQSLKKLLQEIMSSPQYRLSDYGIQGGL